MIYRINLIQPMHHLLKTILRPTERTKHKISYYLILRIKKSLFCSYLLTHLLHAAHRLNFLWQWPFLLHQWQIFQQNLCCMSKPCRLRRANASDLGLTTQANECGLTIWTVIVPKMERKRCGVAFHLIKS